MCSSHCVCVWCNICSGAQPVVHAEVWVLPAGLSSSASAAPCSLAVPWCWYFLEIGGQQFQQQGLEDSLWSRSDAFACLVLLFSCWLTWNCGIVALILVWKMRSICQYTRHRCAFFCKTMFWCSFLHTASQIFILLIYDCVRTCVHAYVHVCVCVYVHACVL